MIDHSGFLFGMGYCAFMFAIALWFYLNPPEKINHIYGYRTHRSKLNPTLWKAANRYANSCMLKASLWSFLVPIAAYFLIPSYIHLATIVVSLLAFIAVIPLTEGYLNKNFHKDGSPKNEDTP